MYCKILVFWLPGVGAKFGEIRRTTERAYERERERERKRERERERERETGEGRDQGREMKKKLRPNWYKKTGNLQEQNNPCNFSSIESFDQLQTGIWFDFMAHPQL